MKKILLVLLILLGSSCSFANNELDVKYISVIDLLSNKEKYDGKRVLVRGYLNLGYESNAIYLNEIDYRNAITKNAIAITLPKFKNTKSGMVKVDNSEINELNNNYVDVLGTFRKFEDDSISIFGGLIEEIEL